MPKWGMSGSVGAPGGKPPGATRPQNCPHEPFLRLKTAPRPSKMSIPALGLRLCGHRADLKVACLAAAEQQQAAASVLPPGAGIMPPAIFCMTGPGFSPKEEHGPHLYAELP